MGAFSKFIVFVCMVNCILCRVELEPVSTGKKQKITGAILKWDPTPFDNNKGGSWELVNGKKKDKADKTIKEREGVLF